MDKINPRARKKDVVVQKSGDETLIYNLKNNKAFCLNQSSATVWSLCNGNRSVGEISDLLSREYKVLVNEDFVWLALDQLAKDGLLENGIEFFNRFSALSRRELIKKIGFASALTLPIVSSLVAPRAALAQSLAANGQACTPLNNALCTSNNCLPAGGVSGICCAAGSTQANAPTYNICTNDGSAAAFQFRCCSGSASPTGGAPCPVGEARYICNPY